MLQKIISLFMIFTFLCVPFAHAQSSNNVENSIQNEKVNRKTFPEWADASNRESRTKLDDRLSILPSEEFGANTFVVYPKMGIVTPLHDIDIDDAELVANGKKFNHYKYLEKGVLQYAGPEIGEIGTAIIAGHSSFRDTTYNPYYTAFQSVPLSNVGDEIWVYKRDSKEIRRYIYEIQESYEVEPNQRAKVEEQKSYSSITTYSCYPLGSNASRRVNHAKLLDIDIELLSSDPAGDDIELIVEKQKFHNAAEENTENILENDEPSKEILSEKIKQRNNSGGSVSNTGHGVDFTTNTGSYRTKVSKNILEKESINLQELTYLYNEARKSVYYKLLFVKVLVQIKQEKKKFIRIPQ